MNALQDTRPHVFREAPDDDAFGTAECFALVLTKLLHEYPDIEITTIRLWRHAANGAPTVRVDARRGQLGEPECPSCHTVAGHPHTEYCQRACSYPIPGPDGVVPCPEQYGHLDHSEAR